MLSFQWIFVCLQKFTVCRWKYVDILTFICYIYYRTTNKEVIQ